MFIEYFDIFLLCHNKWHGVQGQYNLQPARYKYFVQAWRFARRLREKNVDHNADTMNNCSQRLDTGTGSTRRRRVCALLFNYFFVLTQNLSTARALTSYCNLEICKLIFFTFSLYYGLFLKKYPRLNVCNPRRSECLEIKWNIYCEKRFM